MRQKCCLVSWSAQEVKRLIDEWLSPTKPHASNETSQTSISEIKIVTATSSSYQSPFGPELLFDNRREGNGEYAWHSDPGASLPQWVELILQYPTTIEVIGVQTQRGPWSNTKRVPREIQLLGLTEVGSYIPLGFYTLSAEQCP